MTATYSSSKVLDVLYRNWQQQGTVQILDGTMELQPLDYGVDELCFVRIGCKGAFIVEELWEEKFSGCEDWS